MLRNVVCFFFLALTIGSVVSVVSAQTNIMPQAGSPVIIETYKATYDSGIGVRHKVQVRSASAKTIVAARLGVVSFNDFDEFLVRGNMFLVGKIAPGETDSLRLTIKERSGFFLTGFVYVDKVRFSDGEIWAADESEIVEVLRGFQPNFQAQWLKEDQLWRE